MHVVFKKSCAKKSTHISSFHRKYVCSRNWLVCIMVRIGLFSHKMFIAIDRISLLSEQKYSSLGRSEMGELISNKCKNHIQQFFLLPFRFLPVLLLLLCIRLLPNKNLLFNYCKLKISHSLKIKCFIDRKKTNAMNLFIALIRSECLNL